MRKKWRTAIHIARLELGMIGQRLIRNIPRGLCGSKIRHVYYGRVFKSLGRGGSFNEGIIIYGPQGIVCGDNVFFGWYVVVNATGGLTLGNDVLIGPGCYIWTVNHDYQVDNVVRNRRYIAKPVVIEDNCWIGAGAKIGPGVRIGTGCVIAMGSVVFRDMPPNCLVAGNPARVVQRIGRHD